MEQITFTPPLDVVAELLERCDQCGAAAKLHLTLADGALAFCGHHANAHAAMIVRTAVRVTVLSEFAWTGAATPGTPGSTVDGQSVAAGSEGAFPNSR
jgi:hypothetical protein